MSLAPRRRRFTSARLSRHDGPATAPHARSRLSVRAASPLGVQLRGRKPPLPVSRSAAAPVALLGHPRARRRGADGYSSCNGTSASASLAPTSCVKCRAWRRAGTRPPGRSRARSGTWHPDVGIGAQPRVCGGAVLSAGLLEPLAGPSFHGSSSLNCGVKPRSNALP